MSSKGKKHKVSLQLAPAISEDMEDDEARGDKPLVVPPLLVSFPHGQPPESILQSIDFQGMATESKPGQKRRRVCLSGESDYVKYQCAQPTVSRKTLGDYMVGVYNKETEEVVLYPAHAILSMEQKVKGRESEEEDNADTDMSYMERRKSLVENFGTKKKRKSLKSREDNQIQAESVVGLKALGRFLEDTAREAQESGEADANLSGEAALDAHRASLLPPYNAGAKTPAGVYRAREILSEDEWDALSEHVEELVSQCKQEEEDGSFVDFLLSGHKYWPSSVRQKLQVTGMPTNQDQLEHVICLLYLRHLMDFHRGPHVYKGDTSTIASYLHIPEIVASRFLTTFTVSDAPRAGTFSSEGEESKVERHQRTKGLRDKLLLHIIVMYLIVEEGFTVSVSKVATDLSMAETAVVPLFKQTGCTVTKKYKSLKDNEEREITGKSTGGSKQELVAQLTVPLKFPVLKKGGKAKR